MTARQLGSRRLESAAEIPTPGEIVHVIERRLFVGDVRRHFVGEVELCTDCALRVRGLLRLEEAAQ